MKSSGSISSSSASHHVSDISKPSESENPAAVDPIFIRHLFPFIMSILLIHPSVQFLPGAPIESNGKFANSPNRLQLQALQAQMRSDGRVGSHLREMPPARD